MKRRGWFQIPGLQDGDRTVDQQLKGLGRALSMCAGKVVWDFGAAEGVIAREFMAAGAAHVMGLELVHDAVKASKQVLENHAPARVLQCDLNDGAAVHNVLSENRGGGCDIVLMLAVLHKLKDPHALVEAMTYNGSPELVVMRMPESTPGFVQDRRSRMRVFDVHGQMLAYHYGLTHVDRGHFNEWVGYYEKGKPCTAKP